MSSAVEPFKAIEIGAGAYFRGDCLAVMRQLIDDGYEGWVDSVVTDPPYHLTTGKKGGTGPASASTKTPQGRARVTTGFMGKAWDGGDVAFQKETWELALRLLKPGGHLLAFGGSRTYHRLACAVEDAGFEIRDQVMWLYGTGFPKSLDVSKAIDKRAGAEREVVGQMLTHKGDSGDQTYAALGEFRQSKIVDLTAPATPEAVRWNGWGTALKPSHEPIVLARKPLVGTVAENVLTHGTGALNIDGCRVPAPDGVPVFTLRGEGGSVALGDGLNGSNSTGEFSYRGRWPANVIHDGSDEVEDAFAAFGTSQTGKRSERSRDRDVPGTKWLTSNHKSQEYTDKGTASRFFYSAKTPKFERNGSRHPTVKPLSLMRYLTRLVTPPGGTVLDPFSGSGSTLEAAALEGFYPVGIEMTADYWPDIEARLVRATTKLASATA